MQSNLLEVSSLERIRAAYLVLEECIIRALDLHLGDPPRLQQNRQLVLEFKTSIESHRHNFTTAEWSVLTTSLSQMLDNLDEAQHTSTDPPEHAPLQVILQSSSGLGRPRLEIDRQILAQALELAPMAEIGRRFGCSARTVRRRALELGLMEPLTLDGHTGQFAIPTHRRYNNRMSELADEEVDKILHEILIDFPSLGRQMIMGMFRVYGLHVSRERIRQSYHRVVGIPPGFGAPRRIQRRVYNVAGPGALTHMDGWHGLIKFGIVIHMFIDGYSRYITALGVHDNNRADTVLSLFETAIGETGLPSRVRGDHGGENTQVTRKMERERGLGRNSFIWGRSVHNIRCERTWYDLNQVFGLKWKNFFLQLEVFEELAPTDAGHWWLLHHLFLDDIREDAEMFRQGWNKHIMQLDAPSCNASPEEMFFFGMIERGPQGLDINQLEDVADEEYGIDWEGLDDEHAVESFLDNNDPDIDQLLTPRSLNIIDAPVNECPISLADVQAMEETLTNHMGPNYSSRSMEIRRVKWRLALTLFKEALSGG